MSEKNITWALTVKGGRDPEKLVPLDKAQSSKNIREHKYTVEPKALGMKMSEEMRQREWDYIYLHAGPNKRTLFFCVTGYHNRTTNQQVWHRPERLRLSLSEPQNSSTYS